MRKSVFSTVLLAGIVAAFLISSQTAFAVPNPVSWWKFNEGSGITAYDSADNHNGTLVNGPVWTTGRIDSALSFDGSDDYVDCRYAFPSVAGSTTKTIMAWAKSDKTDYSAYAYGSVFTLHRYLTSCFSIKAIGNPATWQFEYMVGPATYSWLDSGIAVIAGRWMHVALVQNGADVICYIDGVPRNSVSDGVAPSVYNPRDAVIGNDSGRNENFFDGTIDDVRIYNRALTAEEIEQLYWETRRFKAFNPNPADGATGVDPNVVLSWWPGEYVASHDVYFGADYNDVNEADINSPVCMGNFDVNSWDPCGLDLLTTYYWRIDEVNNPNIWKGDVWSFNTKPVIKLSRTWFNFAVVGGGSNPDDQILEIRNSGVGTLDWTITYDCNWLHVYPTTGTSTGEPNEVILSADINGLVDGTYTCGLAVSDPNADNSPQTVTVILRIGCFPPDHPHYEFWVYVRSYFGDDADCWCYPRQCHGDADGQPYGLLNYWVSTHDLTILKNAWNKPIEDLVGNEICADFDHVVYGLGAYRVSVSDLAILKSNWNIPNGPDPDCLTW